MTFDDELSPCADFEISETIEVGIPHSNARVWKVTVGLFKIISVQQEIVDWLTAHDFHYEHLLNSKYSAQRDILRDKDMSPFAITHDHKLAIGYFSFKKSDDDLAALFRLTFG